MENFENLFGKKSKKALKTANKIVGYVPPVAAARYIQRKYKKRHRNSSFDGFDGYNDQFLIEIGA